MLLLFNNLLGVLMWLCSCLIILSDDVEVNPGPRNSVSECLSICHWNLITLPFVTKTTGTAYMPMTIPNYFF